MLPYVAGHAMENICKTWAMGFLCSILSVLLCVLGLPPANFIIIIIIVIIGIICITTNTTTRTINTTTVALFLWLGPGLAPPSNAWRWRARFAP